MCVDGVNYTQLKLAIFQLVQQAKLNKEGLEQWEHLVSHLNSEPITLELKEAQERLRETISSLEKVLNEINKLSQERTTTISL